ncbi:MAG: DUF4249 family protein [Ignavibacteriales bacterium]|nr:DUF4249 family protein [Ignavibacteriales bacterium]
MKLKMMYSVFVSLLLVIISGCSEPSSSDDYSNQLVLNAYLFAGKAIDSVYVQRTAQIMERYTEKAVAITGASVRISLMKASDPMTAETTYVLVADPLKQGRFSSPAVILPRRSYSIEVHAGGYPVVTGTTLVPDTFHIVTTLPATLLWDVQQPSIEVGWSPSSGYGDYVASITSTDVDPPFINDFRSKNRNPDDPKPQKTSFFFNIPQRNSVELPWLMFRYLGRHRISVSAVDENYYDFLRQSMAAEGGSLREIRDRLNGGIGVFASAAVATGPIYFSLIQ